MSYRNDEQLDILDDPNGDMSIVGGDIQVGNSIQQNISDILRSNKGEWRFQPLVGCNLSELVNTVYPAQVLNRVRMQLTRDGFAVDAVEFTAGNISVKAKK